MNNEQWKTDGDCSKCRRQKYCSHTCTANKRAITNYISKGVDDFMRRKIGGVQ